MIPLTQLINNCDEKFNKPEELKKLVEGLYLQPQDIFKLQEIQAEVEDVDIKQDLVRLEILAEDILRETL